MTKKNITQMIKAKASAQLLYNNLSLISSYDELQNELNKFYNAFKKDANENNTRPNKAIIGMINYLNLKENKKRNTSTINTKSRAKRLAHKSTYKDYLEEYIILKNRGYSNQKIADYSLKHFKIKVSKETIRKALKEIENAS